ncbi:MAG: hypothetical protein FJ104_05230, partial [Deltaproteobacteria bacterium]|nr:hypothetical protein [Deltaproteobacteria bacterium]
MSSTKGKLLRLLSGVLLQRGVVVAVRDFGGFRRIDLRAELPPFAAGAKVQVLLATDDARTYTPIASPEGLVLVGWKHAGGPGGRWVSSVAVGDVVRFLGPQRSLSVGPGPVVIVGDETSVGVAAALGAERFGQAHAVIQSGAGADVSAAARAVGFTHLDVVPPGDLYATLARV